MAQWNRAAADQFRVVRILLRVDGTCQRDALSGTGWRILVVAIDACGDSMNSVPYVARIAALAGS